MSEVVRYSGPFLIGSVAGLVQVLWTFHHWPTVGEIQAHFTAQQRDSSRYGRVLYPLWFGAISFTGAVFIGLLAQRVSNAIVFLCFSLPWCATLYFVPSNRVLNRASRSQL